MTHYRMIKLCASVALPLLLASCQGPFTTPKPTTGISPEQKQCLLRCHQQQDRCTKQYNKLYQQCDVQQKLQAKFKYSAYKKQQIKLGNKLEKNVNDFVDLSSCRQQLNCKTNYQKCYNSCDL